MRARPHRGGIGLHWRPNFAFLVVLAQEKKVPVASHQTRARELQAVASAVWVLGERGFSGEQLRVRRRQVAGNRRRRGVSWSSAYEAVPPAPQFCRIQTGAARGQVWKATRGFCFSVWELRLCVRFELQKLNDV